MKLNRGTKQNHNMKEKILLASIDLMRKNGINNTSLADIAREVNISKGTLYYHYSSKDDIIFDIADNHLNIISKALLDAAIKQAENYQIKVRLIEDVKYCKAKELNTTSLILKVLVEFTCIYYAKQ